MREPCHVFSPGVHVSLAPLSYGWDQGTTPCVLTWRSCEPGATVLWVRSGNHAMCSHLVFMWAWRHRLKGEIREPCHVFSPGVHVSLAPLSGVRWEELERQEAGPHHVEPVHVHHIIPIIVRVTEYPARIECADWLLLLFKIFTDNDWSIIICHVVAVQVSLVWKLICIYKKNEIIMGNLLCLKINH